MNRAKDIKTAKCLIKLANCDRKILNAGKAIKCILLISFIMKMSTALILFCCAAKK